jgi:hypothetical protein
MMIPAMISDYNAAAPTKPMIFARTPTGAQSTS